MSARPSVAHALMSAYNNSIDTVNIDTVDLNTAERWVSVSGAANVHEVIEFFDDFADVCDISVQMKGKMLEALKRHVLRRSDTDMRQNDEANTANAANAVEAAKATNVDCLHHW